MFARNIIHQDNHAEVVNDPKALAEIRKNIEQGDVYIFRKVIDPERLIKVRDYLTQIGRSSLPNYARIEEGCPNFHRTNMWDPRSYVQACFHQFVFFPWNQDVFDFFGMVKEIYAMRNQLTGLPKDKFLGQKPQDGCIARIAFQFYPKGIGGMNKHRDPYDHHQLTVPVVTMSVKGKDFTTGGAYVDGPDGVRIYTDDISGIGDVVYFNSQLSHGVEKVDEGKPVDWVSFEGRWMLLAAVNKLADNTAIADAEDLEKAIAKPAVTASSAGPRP